MLIPDTFLTVHEETLLFLWSVLMGCALELVYDVLCAFRIAIPHKSASAAIEDILFIVLWAGCLVCFTSVFAKGDLRIFYIAGSILGFIVTRLSVGNPIVRLFSRIIGWICRAAAWLLSPLRVLVVRIYRKWSAKFVRNAKNRGERKNIWSALLIAKQKMLYNMYNHKGKKGDGKRGKKKQVEEP